MKNVLIVSGAYIASIIGAGFASGQEILSFFVKYGKMSIFGVLFSCIIFGLFAYVILCGCLKMKTDSYDRLIGSFTSKSIKSIINIITFVFAVVVFAVMASGCGEMFYTLFGINSIYGVAFMTVVSCVVLMLKTDDAVLVNAFTGGIIVVGIISCTLYILRYREHQAFSQVAEILLSGGGYAGYNLITSGVLLAQMSSLIESKRQAAASAAASSFAVFIIMGLMWLLLKIYYGHINLGEIPMLSLALRESKNLAFLYSILLFAAMFTTAVANGIGIIKMSKMNKYVCIILLASVTVILSNVGFSPLIDTVYRFCGYCGIAIVFFIILNIKKILSKKKIDK